MNQIERRKYAGFSVLVALTATATGVGAVGPQRVYQAMTNPLAVIRHYSPGARAAGAMTNKTRRVSRVAAVAVHEKIRPAKVAMLRRPKRVSAVLPTAVEAPAPVVALPSAPIVPVAAAATPIAGAPLAVTPLLAGGGIGVLPILGGIGSILLATVVLTSHSDVSPR